MVCWNSVIILLISRDLMVNKVVNKKIRQTLIFKRLSVT